MVDEQPRQKFNWLKYFIKLERFSAWVLFAVFIIFGVTGYGMTKGLIPSGAARTLHFGWLGAIVLVPFVIHTSWGISLSLKRHGAWNRFSRIGLIVFYFLLISFFIWAHFFYQADWARGLSSYRPAEQEDEYEDGEDDDDGNRVAAGGGAASADVPAPAVVFTSENLKAYDGLNGRAAYAAVDGAVYDLTLIFPDGRHKGHRAGQDLSAAFHGQHAAAILRGFSVVGVYQEN